MRKMVLLAVMLAMAAMMLAAAPAVADDRDWDRHDKNNKNFDHDKDFDKDFCFFFDCDFDHDKDFDKDFFDHGFVFGDVEQEADSGDIDQDFDVSQTGDNSNQCVGAQGVANTGNAQNTVNVFIAGGEVDDLEFDDLESSIDVSPTNKTSCDQQVNQAAVAHGGYDYGGYPYGGYGYW